MRVESVPGDANDSLPIASPDDTAFLEVHRITKRFGYSKALSDANLCVRLGEIHSLFGANGSGKSTMIKILAGVYAADEGTIRVGDISRPAANWSPGAAFDAGLRFVHQDLGLFPALSVAENLAIGHGFQSGIGGRIQWRQVRRNGREVLARLNIGVDETAIVGHLRRGDQALIAIARALQDENVTGGGVLVLDEPTASLPEHEVSILLDALRRFADNGTAIVFVSHRVEEVMHVADTITVLRDGVDVLTASTATVSKAELARLTSATTSSEITVVEREPTLTALSKSEPEVVLSVRGLRGGPLKDVNLDLHQGEILGVAGLLGSGRSSVLRALFGQLLGTDSEISLDGHVLDLDSPADAIKAGIGYLPEDRADAGFFNGSVSENLSASRTSQYWRHLHFERRKERGDARDAISRYGIRCQSTDQSLSSLSGGNQQKVLLARVLLRKPRIVLLDEPTQGVDVNAKAELWKILRESIEVDKTSVIVVSSDFEELATMADRVLIIVGGRVVSELSQADLSSEVIAREAYGDEEARL